eukprot:scaffold24896_cov189-Skeletonema_dohrnii-CCMP3373.AAC.8
MESFVLNLFSDQLSKVILDFNPNTINANLLSGKGSITNLRLNVDVINEFLNKPPHGSLPFVKFTEIRLSELRVEVTSYTNLKKAPIVLVIEEIHASAVEPMEYYLDPANAQNKAPPPPQQQSSNARQQYGLLHRILDNLSIKINRIHLTFQTLGKFKTLRRGIWTPPPVSVTLENIEWISVSEAGNPGTPESVWAHNELFAQQRRYRKEGNAPQHRSYIIYKRLSMICHVRLSSEAHYEQTGKLKNVESAALISNTQIDVHVAYIRRLRDAGVTGIDVDVLCHDMDINLDIASLSDANNGSNASQSSGCDVGSFVHMMMGLLHCYYKDRSFVDPLLPDGVRNETKQHISVGEAQQLEKGLAESTDDKEPEEEEIGGPDEFMPEVSLMDDDDSESDYEEEPDEEHDEAFLEWKRRYDVQKDEAASDIDAADSTNTVSPTPSAVTVPEKGSKKEGKKDDAEKKAYKRKRKAVIVIASGAQKFEKLSFSLSISRVNVKLFLPSHSSIESNSLNTFDRHCVELLVEGLVAECIWPKVSGEIGGHVQFSFGYVHILDLLQRLCENPDNGENSWTAVKLFPLLKIGTRLFQGHDIFALPQHLKKGWVDGKQFAIGVDKCEEFPSMETRQTTWTWDRPRRGKRAFGLKSTISFVDEKLTTWSKTSVNHEACLGVVDIVLDSVPIDNMVKVFSNQNLLIDARWLSGDWTAEICSDTIATDRFHMKDYLQPLPAFYQSHGISPSSTLPSSELRSITAHLGSFNIRLPNPGGSISSFGMTDVICGFTEATIIVSSDLPQSFLSGRIMACENSSPDFPNDPTDISCTPESQQASSSEGNTQFRMQVSVTNFSVDILPMHQALHRDDINVKSLIAPTNVTLMTSLEQIGATKQSIIVSVLLQELESCINLRLLCGALQTLKYHACNIMLRSNGTSQINGKAPVTNDGGNTNVSLALCFHVPHISVQCLGEDSDLQSKLLFQAKAKQFELGSESMRGAIEHRSVLKLAIDVISVDVCSEGDMLELLSIGSETSHVVALGHIAAESCSLSNQEETPKDSGGLLLRVEHHCDVSGTMPSLSYAIDSKSPLAISLSFDALEVFLKMVVDALSLPVLEQSTSISIGNSIVASIHQLCSIFASSQEDSDAEGYHEERARNTLMRFYLAKVVLLLEVSDEKSFLVLLEDIEIASGQYDKIASLTENSIDDDLFVYKRCGGDNRTWLEAYHLLDQDTKEASATFYALKLQHTVMDVVTGNNFDIVVPTSVVDYRFPIPKGGSSKPSLIDIKSMKKMMRHSMKVGKSFSSSYYKLYSMLYATLSSDLSPTAMRLHALIGDYHEKMQAVIRHMNAEVHSLRKGIFLKERERIGALALASSTASGWVRVGEDSSFSTTRLFTSATFWRYWMVLDKSVIVLYKAPGCTAPSFIIPIHKRTQLRTISMSSSSNKNTVVGNHLRQRGFALFDESEGMELFFVTNNQVEYNMFVSSIGSVLNLMQADSNKKMQTGDESVNVGESNNSTNLLSEAVTMSQTNQTAQVDSSLDKTIAMDANDSNDPLSAFDTTATTDAIIEDSNAELVEETDEMIDIQLDEEEESTEAVFASNRLSQYEQQDNQLQNEDASTSDKAAANASLSMRERLALAKGKSKLATSKFGTTLKTAKLAASEISREDIKQKGSQKMTVLKKTANTKLSSAAVLGKVGLMQATTAVRSSIHHDQSSRTNSADSMDKQNPSKLEKVNKSMSSAMQRLHIDDKVTRISTAVKSVRSESQVVRQLSSEMVSRRKIGIAEEHLNKPVKFDARETFSAISGHPTKVKSIISGESLATNDQVCSRADLQKFNESWLVDVSAVGMSNPHAMADINVTEDVSTKPHHHLKYEITLTDVCNEVNKHSVQRSISELLVFHVVISELLATTNATRDHHNKRLQVASSLLERMVEGNTPPQNLSSVRDMHCEWIKLFASTLLDSYLPEQVLEATREFFDMKQGGVLATRKFSDVNALHPNEESCVATEQTNEAFDTFAKAVSNQSQDVHSYSLVSSPNDRAGSHLLHIIMSAYSEATSERDNALATLAVSSVLNDHHIMQEQLAKAKSNKAPIGGVKRQSSGHQSSDDEMLALCKQLGSEIAARTSAELEINRLKEQLELERKIAHTKEAELLEQISKK